MKHLLRPVSHGGVPRFLLIYFLHHKIHLLKVRIQFIRFDCIHKVLKPSPSNCEHHHSKKKCPH